MELGLSGLASGFDWRSLVDQLADIERAPQTRLRSEQSLLQQRNNAYASIKTQLGVLNNRLASLKDPAFFDSRLTTVSDAAAASATAAAGAAVGSYEFNILQLATASRQLGAVNRGAALNGTNDVSALALGSAKFATAVTAGTFTVNGARVTVAATDTLQAVFDAIHAATGGAVTGAYDAATDRITLSSASPIVLGSAADTSNFLQVARLTNNGTGTITSSANLGAIRLNEALNTANFSTAISDGGAGAGEFKINGVSIAYNAATDSVATVLARINNSGAGVTAGYDPVNDRFVLTNKVTGDLGLALEDVTGNFLAATGLSGGTLSRGSNLRYTINGGGELVSQSNTITEGSSGIAGLSVTALKEGAVTVTVASDTAKIKAAIQGFVTEFNKAQSVIDAQTASSTDAKGKVTAGVLAGDSFANEISARLRSLANATVSGLGGVLRRLDDIGIASSGDSDALRIADEERLNAALGDKLDSLKELFTHAANGIGVRLAGYLDRTGGEDGALETTRGNLTRQAGDIDTQIADLERIVQANRQRMIDSFIAMEEAQAKINQQLQFLLQRFGSGASS
jgi:flagellar hook-associated protein 2